MFQTILLPRYDQTDALPFKGASCTSVQVWAWVSAVWQPGSPLASWATLVWEAPPSSRGFLWAWSWSWFSLRCWGSTALSWPSSCLQNKCLHHNTISFIAHRSSKNKIFSYFHYTPWVWQDGMATEMLVVNSKAVSSVDVIHSYCLKPSSCVRSCAYRTGMKVYWLLWNNVWTVCLICRLILTCTVIQSPSTLCKCSNSLCCECEYQRLYPSAHSPPLFMVFVSGFEHSPFWDYWRFVHCCFIFFHVLFLGTIFELQWWGTDKIFFFFTIY